MKLYEAIQDLKTMQSEAKEALKEAKAATNQSTLQRAFKESFDKELQGLQNHLNKVSEEILGTKANELSTQNKVEVLKLFNEQRNAIIQEAVSKLPLQTLSEAIAKEFSEQNKENLSVAINEVIGKKDSELNCALAECRESLHSTIIDFKKAINDKKEDILTSADNLIYGYVQDYLSKNPNAIFENMDEESIKGGIVAYLNTKPQILENIDKKALEIAKERVSFLVIQEEIQRILEAEAINVFEKALGYQDLIEKRFLAGLQLGALCLLGELGSLSKILSALSDIQTEENRLQALRDFESGKPYQKIFMEI
ncbi:hypothetical protein [Helicobacter sp.]|uniref:hypothetical protein n=1 Tax=Helicobacter sp. TaxID=218 RepID=UPI0019A1B326|nr:hypothetical protein [Helicobacter sp.]MBD5165226.1 hypothetical protein [Helicobacter sp.]